MAIETFIFEQAVPASDWIITHNFVSVPVIDVTVTDNSVAEKMHPSSIVQTSSTVLTIHFSSPRTGRVRLVGAVANT